jgi:hypothetical protein
MEKVAFIYSSELEKFSYPADCPFNTDRAGQVRKILNSMPGADSINIRLQSTPQQRRRQNR